MYGNGYGYGYGYGGWGVPNGYGQPSPTAGAQQFGRYPTNGQTVDAPNTQKPTLQVPWVNGEVGAQAYMVAPNSTVLLMDSDNPVFYIKTSDMSGKASIKSYKYEECSEASNSSSPCPYVTREEFEKFKSEFLGKVEEARI